MHEVSSAPHSLLRTSSLRSFLRTIVIRFDEKRTQLFEKSLGADRLSQYFRCAACQHIWGHAFALIVGHDNHRDMREIGISADFLRKLYFFAIPDAIYD